MKKHNLTIFALLLGIILSTSVSHAQSGDLYYYQLKVYHLGPEGQPQAIDQYLEEAYIPALHRAGIAQVGVFHTIEDEAPKIYVLAAYPSLEKAINTESTLEKDQKYQKAGSDYLNAAYDAAPYERIETLLLKAFSGMPAPEAPDLKAPKSERFYELRSYEGPTEKLYASKVDMFNKGDEVSIFDRLGFNAVFYAEVLFGGRMPNLMYMTTFENREERDKLWEDFNNDAAWNKLKAMDQYQHTVSKADLIFLRPTAYSDF
ncbi:MAG: NIPSNAP family protein [Cyclobacteriaceae bacterium]